MDGGDHVNQSSTHRDRRYRRRGRDWPVLVGRRDVQVGPRGQRGNEVGRGYPALERTRRDLIRARQGRQDGHQRLSGAQTGERRGAVGVNGRCAAPNEPGRYLERHQRQQD